MKSIFQKKYFHYLLFAALLGAAVTSVLVSDWRRQKKMKEAVAARRAEVAATTHDQGLQKFSLSGYDDKGKTFWNLEGDKAKISVEQTVTLQENVTLRLKDDTIVKTDHVEWNQNNSLMTTPAPVFVDHKNAKIHGRGAVGRPNEGFLQLNRDIHMIIDDKTKVDCRGPMKVYYKQNKIILYREVVVQDERGILKANRMDVFFDPTQNKVNQIVAVGGVVIERGADTTRSERVIYDPKTGSIRLEGNPEITMKKVDKENFDVPFGN